MQHVYVITAGQRMTKIGIAANPQQRLRELQTGCPFKLRIFDTFPGSRTARHRNPPRFFPADIEREVHRRLAAFRLEGEWFAIEPAEAMAIITAVVSGGPPKTEYAAPPPAYVQPATRSPKLALKPGLPLNARELTCPHCQHTGTTSLTNKQLWAKTFRCSGCNQSVEGRRFFIKRVA